MERDNCALAFIMAVLGRDAERSQATEAMRQRIKERAERSAIGRSFKPPGLQSPSTQAAPALAQLRNEPQVVRGPVVGAAGDLQTPIPLILALARRNVGGAFALKELGGSFVNEAAAGTGRRGTGGRCR
jgi:hypothetical protein